MAFGREGGRSTYRRSMSSQTGEQARIGGRILDTRTWASRYQKGYKSGVLVILYRGSARKQYPKQDLYISVYHIPRYLWVFECHCRLDACYVASVCEGCGKEGHDNPLHGSASMVLTLVLVACVHGTSQTCSLTLPTLLYACITPRQIHSQAKQAFGSSNGQRGSEAGTRHDTAERERERRL